MTPASFPLILTLRLDEASQAFFDGMRKRHFPPARNVLAAHVTLFHKLPRDEEPAVRVGLKRAAAREPFPMQVEGLRSLGGGVAYRLASPDLARLHADLAFRWAALLSAQDRQKLQPHVTVQNKAKPEEARALLAELQAGFTPWEARALGLDLWDYRGGPWGFVDHFPFAN